MDVTGNYSNFSMHFPGIGAGQSVCVCVHVCERRMYPTWEMMWYVKQTFEEFASKQNFWSQSKFALEVLILSENCQKKKFTKPEMFLADVCLQT